MLPLWTGTWHLWKPLVTSKGRGRQCWSSAAKRWSRSTHPVRDSRLGWRSRPLAGLWPDQSRRNKPPIHLRLLICLNCAICCCTSENAVKGDWPHGTSTITSIRAGPLRGEFSSQRLLRRFFVFLELFLRQLFDSDHLYSIHLGQSSFKLLAIVGEKRTDQFVALLFGPEVTDLSVLT